MWFDSLKEKDLWESFENLSRIPRESGNEEGIRKYLVSWARENGFDADTDKIGNVFIYVPASKGREKEEPICFQGHMDMVCVKTPESTHDFTKDPIEIVCDGKTVRAKDTSLGADNGIAIAMSLALAKDKKLSHPALELLFTVSEETGLTGAFNLDGSKLKARRLINLDSEEEGVIYTGCAGGIDIQAKKKARMKEVDTANSAAFTLSVSGLLGGHSGGEIHKGRANAIKVLARIMHHMPDFRIVDIQGGSRRNVIPSTATLTFVVEKEYSDLVESLASEIAKDIKNEYSLTDPGLEIILTKLDKVPLEAVKLKTSLAFMEALYLTPHGPSAMSAAVPGIVETSNNLAIVSFKDEKLYAECSTRSLVESARDEHATLVAAAYEDFGLEASFSGAYPSWAPNPDSPLTKKVAALYKAHTKKKPVVTCIHAGLECGIINSVVEGMDSISIGPNLFDVHSVNEHIEVDSAERTMNFLRYLLENL